jgi:RNA polymerase sigma-70 factor
MAAQAPRLTDAEYQRLHRAGHAARWGVSATRFAAAIDAALAHAARGGPLNAGETSRRAAALHLDDLALATACIDGRDDAWEHFIREYRPGLYRAADALDPGGGTRELADALYADLYGVTKGEGERRSLLLYYHGRSALGTWLRAVLSQRLIDRVRASKRLAPLPDEPSLPAPIEGVPDPLQPHRAARIGQALTEAVAALEPDDRLRLASYYQQQLTLAQIGRLLGEHEATVSRQLARTRRTLRAEIEARLHRAGLTEAEVGECFEAAVGEASPLDLSRIFGRKIAPGERSR